MCYKYYYILNNIINSIISIIISTDTYLIIYLLVLPIFSLFLVKKARENLLLMNSISEINSKFLFHR